MSVNICKQDVMQYMPDKHLQANRGWALVRNKLRFEPNEEEHLEQCAKCHYWLSGFTEMARRAGFEITYSIPKLRLKNGTDG
jgi:hypothetical protein